MTRRPKFEDRYVTDHEAWCLECDEFWVMLPDLRAQAQTHAVQSGHEIRIMSAMTETWR